MHPIQDPRCNAKQGRKRGLQGCDENRLILEMLLFFTAFPLSAMFTVPVHVSRYLKMVFVLFYPTYIRDNSICATFG